jgi:hypothetical protein
VNWLRSSGGGEESPIASGVNTRRNSLSGFFRTKSTNFSSPAAVQTASSAQSNHEVDLIGKEALADPAGVMFHADETPDLYSTAKNSSSDFPPPAHFEDDDVDEDASRVSFSVTASSAVPQESLTPPKRAISIQRSTSGNAGVVHNNIMDDFNSSVGSAEQHRVSSLHAFDARSQQSLDLLNTAIFDHQKAPLMSDGALQPGAMSGMTLNVFAEGAVKEALDQQSTTFQRHKSVKLNSLLNDMLDLKLDEEKEETDAETNGAANVKLLVTTCNRNESVADINSTAEVADSSADESQAALLLLRAEKSLFEGIGDAGSEAPAVELEGSVIVNNTTEVGAFMCL